MTKTISNPPKNSPRPPALESAPDTREPVAVKGRDQNPEIDLSPSCFSPCVDNSGDTVLLTCHGQIS